MKYLITSLFLFYSILAISQDADSLVSALNTVKGKQKISILNNLVADLGYYYPDSAKNYSKEALNLAEELGDDSVIAETIHTGIYPYLGSGQYKEYQTPLKYAIKLWRSLNLIERELASLNNLAVLELYAGDVDSAMKTVLTKIKIAEQIKDTLNLAESYMLLSSILSENENREEAVKYIRKALRIFLKTKDKGDLGRAYSNLGNNIDYLGKRDSAKYFLLKGLEMFELSEDLRELAKSYHNIGVFFEDEPDSSILYLKKALTLHLLTNDSILIGSTYSSLSTQSGKINEIDSSLFYAEQAVFYSKNQYLEERISALTALSEVTYLLSDFKRTSELNKEIIHLQDSLYKLSRDEKVDELMTQFETEKKEQQIKIQNASISEQASELRAKQRTILALVILSLLIVVISFAVYKRFQARKNAEVQNRIIEEQEKGLQAVFTAQEEERKRISKDLHDGIGQQLSGLKMAIQNTSSRLSEKIPEEKDRLDNLAKIASESADEVRAISHQMMPRALTELGLIDAISDMLEKSISLSQIEYEFEHFGITERLNERVEISLYRVAQELVNNIIKHSNAKKVNLQIFKNSGKVIMVVEDDGKGMDLTQGNGHGLLNMKSRINTLNGELNLEPSPNSGTLATVRIPI